MIPYIQTVLGGEALHPVYVQALPLGGEVTPESRCHWLLATPLDRHQSPQSGEPHKSSR